MTRFGRRSLASSVAVAAFSLALSSSWAAPNTPAPEGASLVIDFTATLSANSVSDIKSGRIMHTLRGSCRLEAGPLQPFGVMGPTKEQEKAMQNAGPSQGMKDLERAVAACKGDQQCLQRVAQSAAAAPPTGPNGTGGSIQPWYARSCSGSFKVEDQFVTTDPGGEGGGGAYKETRTVSGQNIIPEGGEDGWHGAFMDHDVAKGTTSYYFTTISPMTFDMLSVRTGYGAGTKQTKQPVAFYEGMLPTPFAVLPYPPAQGKASHPVSGGTLTVEWKIRK